MSDIANEMSIDNLNANYAICNEVTNVALHVINGGDWLVRLYLEEALNSQVELNSNVVKYNNDDEDSEYEPSDKE